MQSLQNQMKNWAKIFKENSSFLLWATSIQNLRKQWFLNSLTTLMPFPKGEQTRLTFHWI